MGSTNFTPAGNIWVRGILEEYYGVPHNELTWVVERSEDVEFTPPASRRRIYALMTRSGSAQKMDDQDGVLTAMANSITVLPAVR